MAAPRACGKSMEMSMVWTKETPTAKGYYWARDRRAPKAVWLVDLDANGQVYTFGNEMPDDPAGFDLWCPAERPPIPEGG